jgi:mRNA-degrading endonuclease RelE of RelBE toxin-antitoxin system
MRTFKIILTAHAIAGLERIPEEERPHLHADIRDLQSSPFPQGTRIKRLKGYRPPLYRLRSRECGVLYRIGGETITVLRIIDRKLLERVIRHLRL